jgi:uncharacterized membrane protein
MSSEGMQTERFFRIKNVIFALIAAMALYVLYHFERFVIDWSDPVWKHYQALGVPLLVHVMAGGTALILAPMQFSERLRTRYAKLHRIIGRIYVVGALVLAPFGVYTQWLDETQGFPRSFTIETVVQASILMTTTAFAFYFGWRRMIPQHRQWMFRSYAAALTFFEIRLVIGLTGWESDPAIVETVVWCFTATSVLVGDIANQFYEINVAARARAMRRQPAMQAAE